MRKFALVAAFAAIAVVGVAGVAQAVDAEHKLKVTTTPTKAGTSSKPANMRLFTDLITIPGPNDPPFATKTAVVSFDKNIVFNTKNAKSCSKSQVQADESKCPSGSKLGAGKATGTALGQKEELKVTAFNGGSNKIELHVVGNQPLVIDSVIEGKLVTASGKFGKKLNVTVPENLQQPLTGVFATLTDFQVAVKGGTSSKPFIGLKGCPSNKKLSFSSTLTFTDGTKKTAVTTTNCSK